MKADFGVIKSNETFNGSFTVAVSGMTISYGDFSTETSDTPSYTYTGLPPYLLNIKNVDNSSITEIAVSGNNMTACDVSRYKNLSSLNVSSNELPKSEVSNLLVSLDGSGLENGTFKASGNVLDVDDLTVVGQTARTNLIGKGWNVTGTSGELWTPSQLTTQMWFDASDADTITIGTGVQQWDDKSGFERHVTQNSSTVQPIYDPTGFNGMPTLNFRSPPSQSNKGDSIWRDVTGDNMPVDDITVFAVVNDLSNDTSNWIMAAPLNNGSNEIRLHLGLNGPRVDNDGTGDSDSNGVLLRDKQQLMYEVSTNSKVRQNGVQVSGTSTAYTPYSFKSNIVIGARSQTNGHSGLNGDLSEIIYISGTLTTDEIERIEGYLAHKWGIEDRLPYSHQYKHNAPLSSEVKPNLFIPSDISTELWLDSSDTSTITGLESEKGILDLTANSGLNPQTNEEWKAGDAYRLMFVTSTTISASGSDISAYNDHVNNAVSLGPPSLSGANWNAVVSTATVNVRDNTNTTSSDVESPILQLDGTIIARDVENLWGGNAVENICKEDENGVAVPDHPAGPPFANYGSAWTGTNKSGETSSPVGSGTVSFGITQAEKTFMFQRGTSTLVNEKAYIYALSEVLYVQDNLDQWDDKSGNNNHATQSTQIDKPESGTVIDGKNAISFDSSYLQLTSQITNSRAVFVVTESISGSSVDAITSPLFGEVTDLQDYTFVRTNTDDYDISIDGSLSTTGSASTNGNDVVSGTDIDLSLSQAQKADLRMWYVEFDSSVNIDFIGALENSSTFKLKGDMAEVIVLSSVPTTEVKQQLEGYLAHKWGLTINLPVSHPYKTLAPTV